MRDKQIDLLRFLGLSLIILAHVDPPLWLDQLRNFDVPLMVLVSGLSFVQSKRTITFQSYVWKRFKRLVLPVWIFLTLYFAFLLISEIHLSKTNPRAIAESYLFLKGIGYVWIIRVFLIVAMTAPFIYSLSNKIKSNQVYLFYVLAGFALYELLLYLTKDFSESSTIFYYVSLLLYYGVAYSLLFALGVRLQQLSKTQALSILGFAAAVCVGIGVYYFMQEGAFVETQLFKYPPGAYYLSYSIALSMLVWLLGKPVLALFQKNKKVEECWSFIAQNSIWMYLWHIPFVEYFEYPLIDSLIVRYVLVFGCAYLMTFIQVWFIKTSVLPLFPRETAKKNIKSVFTG